MLKISEISDTTNVGNKAINLNILFNLGLNIPNGFVITNDELSSIKNDNFPNKLLNDLHSYLDYLETNVYAVRSSSSFEDGKDLSFAGVFDSYINVNREIMIENIIKCYYSIFNTRANHYLTNFDNKEFSKSNMSVIVQEMIKGEVSGVAFSSDPVTGIKNKIIIEANNGLCEDIVSGKITPVGFSINKNEIDNIPNNLHKLDISIKNYNELISNILMIEKSYKMPVDLEWTISSGKLYFLQSRPITSYASKKIVNNTQENLEVILHGEIASKGYVKGKVVVIRDIKNDISKFNDGCIIVTEETNPDLLQYMISASAILTSKGGILSHAAIVSRELEIPCLVGIDGLFSKIHDGMEIVVNADKGEILKNI